MEIIPKVDRWTTQIWHCDPLLVTDQAEEVLYADKATVEFDLLPPDGEFIGHARVTDAEDGPPIEIKVLSRMDRADRVPDIRLGMRNGITLLGVDSSGQGVAWYTDGAADLFATCRGQENAPETRHWGSLVIRDVARGEILFSGPADVARGLPASEEDLESRRVIDPANPDSPFVIEVRDTRRLWPTLAAPRFGELCVGTDANGREVEWNLGGHSAHGG